MSATAASKPAAARAKKKDGTLFVKAVVFVNCLIPLIYMVWDWQHHDLGPNPVDYVTRATGTLTILFLTLTLAVTPLQKLTGWGMLNKLRRMIGLYAFFYGTLHLFTYLWWDQGFDFGSVTHDIVKRTFILVGFAAWFLMMPLAITSTNKMQKRLGKKWKLLHRLTYVSAALGFFHFYMLVKADVTRPVRYGMGIGGLLVLRIVMSAKKRYFKGAKRTKAATIEE
jgi:sulfoxide reductase heme-binding subunit YedZ